MKEQKIIRNSIVAFLLFTAIGFFLFDYLIHVMQFDGALTISTEAAGMLFTKIKFATVFGLMGFVVVLGASAAGTTSFISRLSITAIPSFITAASMVGLTVISCMHSLTMIDTFPLTVTIHSLNLIRVPAIGLITASLVTLFLFIKRKTKWKPSKKDHRSP